MSTVVPFRFKLTGDIADQHQFEGYDGYMSLAGFAWMLSLAANYADTGQIRQRGNFTGRHAVLAKAPKEGSVTADFIVTIINSPKLVFGGAVGITSASLLMTSLVKRVIDSNLGLVPQRSSIDELVAYRSGDLEALTAFAEAPIRRAHDIIGNGALKAEIFGGANIINSFDQKTKAHVIQNVEDNTVISKQFSVSAFNANSGYGSVYDSDLHHVVPISMNRENLKAFRSVFSWGLDQYARGLGGKIDARYTRILNMDDRPKRYVILSAERPK